MRAKEKECPTSGHCALYMFFFTWRRKFIHFPSSMENLPRSPSVCFQLRLEEAFISWEKQAQAWLFKLTTNHCTMTFLLHSHQRPLKRALAAAAERKNNISTNKPHRACQAE